MKKYNLAGLITGIIIYFILSHVAKITGISQLYFSIIFFVACIIVLCLANVIKK